LGACEQAETHSIVQQTAMTARSTPWSVTPLVSLGPAIIGAIPCGSVRRLRGLGHRTDG